MSRIRKNQYHYRIMQIGKHYFIQKKYLSVKSFVNTVKETDWESLAWANFNYVEYGIFYTRYTCSEKNDLIRLFDSIDEAESALDEYIKGLNNIPTETPVESCKIRKVYV